jgi:hypothetical protein
LIGKTTFFSLIGMIVFFVFFVGGSGITRGKLVYSTILIPTNGYNVALWHFGVSQLALNAGRSQSLGQAIFCRAKLTFFTTTITTSP